jgi:excisionase family DNA binding protein
MSDSTDEVRVPDLLTVMEAGAVARISRTTAYELAHQFLATNGKSGMPAKRVGGQIRIPRDRFEEWIGTAITVWPPVTGDSDIDDITVIAVNDTPKSITSTKPSRRTTSRRTTTPQTPQLFSV